MKSIEKKAYANVVNTYKTKHGGFPSGFSFDYDNEKLVATYDHAIEMFNKEVLRLTALSKILEKFDSIEEAVASLLPAE